VVGVRAEAPGDREGAPGQGRPHVLPLAAGDDLPMRPVGAPGSELDARGSCGRPERERVGGDVAERERQEGAATLTVGAERDETKATLSDGSRERLTNNAASDFNPAWSPDGTKIAFDRTPSLA